MLPIRCHDRFIASGPSVPLDEATSFNRRCTPDTVAISEDQSALWWTDVSHAPEYVVGDAALSINPSEPYELFYPVRDGRLNTSSTRSKQSSFDDVVRIWTYAIEHTLGVTKKEFSNHKILIIVPDLFERETIKSFLDIALHELRFCAAFCHQESVCTSFGAGLQSAAVINVGHTTTSVSCVDDGISVPASRLRLNFGGDDIARTLFWLLGRIHFPFRECSLASRMDRLMLRDLAHRLCRASSGGCSVAQTEFFVRGEHGLDRYGLKYTDQVNDPPPSFFNSALAFPCRRDEFLDEPRGADSKPRIVVCVWLHAPTADRCRDGPLRAGFLWAGPNQCRAGTAATRRHGSRGRQRVRERGGTRWVPLTRHRRARALVPGGRAHCLVGAGPSLLFRRVSNHGENYDGVPNHADVTAVDVGIQLTPVVRGERDQRDPPRIHRQPAGCSWRRIIPGQGT